MGGWGGGGGRVPAGCPQAGRKPHSDAGQPPISPHYLTLMCVPPDEHTASTEGVSGVLAHSREQQPSVGVTVAGEGLGMLVWLQPCAETHPCGTFLLQVTQSDSSKKGLTSS